MSTKIYTSNGKILINGSNNKWLRAADPFNPLGLNDRTVRVKIDVLGSNYQPYIRSAGDQSKYVITVVDAENGIYDVTSNKIQNGGYYINIGQGYADIEIGNPNNQNDNHTTYQFLGINATGFNQMTFASMGGGQGYGLAGQIPIFDVSTLTTAGYMFTYNRKVTGGILDTYNRLLAFGAQLTSHTDCFDSCGADTVTGAAELAEIPSDWK